MKEEKIEEDKDRKNITTDSTDERIKELRTEREKKKEANMNGQREWT